MYMHIYRLYKHVLHDVVFCVQGSETLGSEPVLLGALRRKTVALLTRAEAIKATLCKQV